MTYDEIYEVFGGHTPSREPNIEIELTMKDAMGDIKARGTYYSVKSLEEDLYKYEGVEEAVNEENEDFANDNRI